ncbi:uncharacterized protein N7443_000275 [Penicillium atrosanguineum]|uniref:uncharacterized protein n=1 Tax=Penicillium atrosanguineum TaxID=1132637 RepID=UPI002385DA95|nr:uncharacterized protein N7443_000275 [Penicillium atrosanguineum]KAJ5313391.1 hypothetical protein N7443_000275 [Penicillium atrosanguineum]
MSEGTLASAVAIPEQDSLRQSPELPAKRRKSSVTEHDPKRRRLSAQDDGSPQSQTRRLSSPAQEPEQPAEKRPTGRGREDERKRGQRLFGGLLGTLSQSSNPAAQKRRADIEKRQQDKLKSQDSEHDGQKQRHKDRRDAIRRKEKPFYEREAIQTRHSNLVAMAHFLKTKTEPALYYKPWQLRSGDEAVIQEQIEDAKATVTREVAEFEARYPPEAFVRQDLEPVSTEEPTQRNTSEQQPESNSEQPSAPEPQVESNHQETTEDTVGAQGNTEQDVEAMTEAPTNGADGAAQEQPDGHHDDGGEVVEDNEDTVIY